MGQTYVVDIDTGLPAALGAAAPLIDPILDDLEQVANLTVADDLSTIEGLEVSSLTLGASNLNGFIGIGDPDLDSPLDGQDLQGFGLTEINLGLALFKPTVPVKKLPKFTALTATVGSVSTQGFGDDFDVQADGVTVHFNNGKKWPANLGTPTIDFQKSFESSEGARDGSLEISTGGTPVTIDYDGNVRKGLSIEVYVRD